MIAVQNPLTVINEDKIVPATTHLAERNMAHLCPPIHSILGTQMLPGSRGKRFKIFKSEKSA
jgi:hypothetical protein